MSERVLIVDDHPLTQEALASLLTQHGFEIVAQASSGDEAIRQAAKQQPDLVLLDLSMPGMSGLEALPEIRRVAPGSEVVVLTASGTEENLLRAIKGGASGYLLKTEPPPRIVEFLRGVINGEAALSGTIARRLLEQVRDGAATTPCPTRSPRSCRPVSSRCFFSSTSTWAPRRSPTVSSSPSTRCARTSRACSTS